MRTFLPSLIENSNIIVHGKIISIQKETFQIAVITKIKSLNSIDTLTILKFNDWTCASRYSYYKKGQEAIYFLRLNRDNKLQAIGAANEGELIVKEKTTYIESYGHKKIDSKQFNLISLFNEYIPMDPEIVIKGIKIYMDNLDVINQELSNKSVGTLAYQYSYIDKLPKNDFLNIVIDQKQKGLQ